MTHATTEEIHDHAYGFRLSEHVAGCAECGRAAEAVTAERETLRDVLEEDPASAPPELLQRLKFVEPKRRRTAPAALAAAAVLLAALAWVLFQPQAPVAPSEPASPPPTQEAEIERLIGELKNSKPRSEIAWVALRAYGGAAVEPLKKARAVPALIDECRGIPIADQLVIQKLRETGVIVDLADVSLLQAVDHLREKSGASIHFVGVDNPDAIRVSLKLRGASVYQCLERLRDVTKLPFSVKDGIVLVGREQPATESWAPLRLSPRIEAAQKLAAGLENGKPREQEAAVAALRKLGFSAEPVLWNLLDSPDLGVQSLAANLLRTLYTRGSSPELLWPGWQSGPGTAAVRRTLEEWKGDLDFQNASPLDVIANLSNRTGVSILIDPRADFEAPITFRVKGLVLKNILKLLLSQFQLDFAVGDGWVLVAKPDRMTVSKTGPVWMAPEEAKAAQVLLLDAVSPDKERREKAGAKLMATGRPALPWLGCAADASVEPDAAIYRGLHRDLAESLNLWVADRPTGVDLQTLTEPQKAILARPMAAGQKGLEGLPIVVKIPGEVRVICSATPGVTLGSFLKAVTRIQGLDLYMAGNEIVIDTAANVRKTVEK